MASFALLMQLYIYFVCVCDLAILRNALLNSPFRVRAVVCVCVEMCFQ